jgi:predicted SprT family Zn-dependent metalloprotease
MALFFGYFVGKQLSGKPVSHKMAQVCECCQTNPARVRIDRIHEGRRESHFFCQSCAHEFELMNARG